MNRQAGFDTLILYPVLFLLLVGCFMVYSSTAVMGMKSGNDLSYFIRHIQSMIVGLMGLVVFMFVDYRHLRRLAIPLLVISLLGLLLVFVPGLGVSVKGARRWLRLPHYTFQPAELAKLAMVIFMADYVSRPPSALTAKGVNAMGAIKKKMEDPLTGFAIPLGVLGLFAVALLLQPDLGSFLAIACVVTGIMFAGGTRIKYLAMTAPPAIALVGVLIWLKPYRMRRITAFLDPWKDAQGSGYQLVQSLISFGNGGLLGRGVGEGRQKLFFLPEPHTDFIFSMIGEEVGLVGALAVVILFAFLFYRGLRLHERAADLFGQYLALGLTLWITFQAMIHFGVATGLLPTKGLTLPYVSYGGSSMLVCLSATGILLNISRTRRVGYPARSGPDETPVPVVKTSVRSRNRFVP